jgi:hypothetical protein
MMHLLKSLLALAFLHSLVLASTSQEIVGARPSGMAGAFVGVADDGNALYWNPAGMAFLNHHEITSMYCDLFGLDITNNYVAYTYPLTSRAAIGIDWFNTGYSDPELEYGFNKFNFGAAYRISSRISAGALLKYLNTSTSFDSRSIGEGHGWTGDVGVLCKPTSKLSAGLVVTNLFDGDISYNNGAESQFYEMGLRLGAGYRPAENILVAADIDDRIHLGGEFVYEDILALRSGIQRDLGSESENVLSFGLGLRYSAFQVDYSYTMYPHLDNTNRISLSAFFNFGRHPVKINKVELASNEGLFPALWDHYRQAPYLQFELQNLSGEPMQCAWEVDLPDMTDAPSGGEAVLRANEAKTVYASASFSENFYANPADAFSSGNIAVVYSVGRDRKSVSKKFQAFVFGRGAIDWDAGVARIASFINPKDPALRDFTTDLIEQHSDLIDRDSPARNLHFAMAVVNGLRGCGVKYIADPNNPYTELENKADGIDDIQYPVELLNSRVGDCDDLTALLCAMLESIGIETVIIDVPGHLYMMFDTEVTNRNLRSLMVDEDLTIDYLGRTFIPLEVTELSSGFSVAWSSGASQYSRTSAMNELSLIDLRDAWTQYSPVPLSEQVEELAIDVEASRSGMQADLAALEGLNRKYMKERYDRDIDQ